MSSGAVPAGAAPFFVSGPPADPHVDRAERRLREVEERDQRDGEHEDGAAEHVCDERRQPAEAAREDKAGKRQSPQSSAEKRHAHAGAGPLWNGDGLGVDPPEPDGRPMRPQADDLSRGWVERFRADDEARATARV